MNKHLMLTIRRGLMIGVCVALGQGALGLQASEPTAVMTPEALIERLDGFLATLRPMPIQGKRVDPLEFWRRVVYVQDQASKSVLIPAIRERFLDHRLAPSEFCRLIANGLSYDAVPLLPDLIRLLDDQDQAIADEAAKTLSSMRVLAVPAIPALVARLRRTGRGSETLAAISKQPDLVIPALDEVIQGQDQEYRCEAIVALGSFHEAAMIPIPKLVHLLCTTRDSKVFAAAVTGLAKCDGWIAAVGGVGQAVPELIDALEDENLADYALMVLDHLGDEATPAVPAIAQSLLRPGKWVLDDTPLVTLANLGHRSLPALPALRTLLTQQPKQMNGLLLADFKDPIIRAIAAIGPAAEEAVPEVASFTPQYQVARSALLRLGERGITTLMELWPNLPPLDGGLSPYLNYPTNETVPLDMHQELPSPAFRKAFLVGPVTLRRELAALHGCYSHYPWFAPFVVDAAMQETDGVTLKNHIWAITALKVPAVPAMIRALEHSDLGTARAGAWALGNIGAAAKPAIPALLAAVEHGPQLLRADALIALGSSHGGADVCAAARTHLQDQDPCMAVAAAGCLLRLEGQDPVLLGKIAEMLEHPDRQVRYYALMAAQGADSAASGLVSSLKRLGIHDGENHYAIEALGHVGPADLAIPALTDEQHHEWHLVANALRERGQEARSALPFMRRRLLSFEHCPEEILHFLAQVDTENDSDSLAILDRGLSGLGSLMRSLNILATLGSRAKATRPFLVWLSLHHGRPAIRQRAREVAELVRDEA